MARTLLLIILSSGFALSSFAATTGVLMNPEGQPVAGARIEAFAQETPQARRDRWVSDAPQRKVLVAATSNERGRFTIETPKEHSLTILQIEAPGFAPHSLRVERDEDIGAIALAPAAMKKGRITAGGKPVAGARVIWSDRSEVIAVTDAAGDYSVPDPAKWANWILVSHADYAPLYDGGRRGMSRHADLDRTLEKGVTISGRVLAADGKTPFMGATVSVDRLVSATSIKDGSFSIEHVPARWEWLEARTGSFSGRRAKGSNFTVRLAPSVVVRGTVRDSKTQTPIAGAEISFLPPDRGPGSTISGTITDEKGNFTLAGVAPGTYRLVADHPAYSFTATTATVSGGDNSLRTVVGTRLARVSGSVSDELRNPVAGARISAQMAAQREFAPPVFASNPAMSGPDGSFTIRFGPDQDMQIEASRKGFPAGRSTTLRLSPGERKSGVLITIPAGVTLTGRVVDAGGDPVSGVSIASAETQTDANMARRMIIRGAFNREREEDFIRTAADGTFSMQVKEGSWDLLFRRDGFAPKSVRAHRVTRGGEPLQVTLEPAVEISGRVTRGGAGLGEATVSVFADGVQESAETLPDGSFRITELAAGNLMLSVSKEDEFIRVNQPVTAPARDLEIKVPPGGRVSGRVFDKETKQPITAFEAGISGNRSGGGMVMIGPSQTRAFTTDDGSFTLDNVPVGTVSIVVSAGGYVTADVPNVVVEEGKAVENVEVALDRGVRVTGRVTGPDGAALSGVTVRLDQPVRRPMIRPNFMDTATTDSSGQYVIEAVEAGEQTFIFSRSGYVNTEKSVELSGRDARVDAQLTTGLRISGVVLGENGGPVADAVVSAFTSAASANSKSTRTDQNGGFQLEAMAPGRYTFRANKQGYTAAVLRDVDITTGTPVRLLLKTGGTIYGRVLGLSAAELAQARVDAFGPSGNASAVPDATGQYRIEGAPTGTVKVFARTTSMGSGRASAQKSIQVEAGATVQQDIEFTAGTTIRGRVTRDGQPLSNAMVIFAPRDGQAQTSARTQSDSAGNYEVTGLDDATYNVIATDVQRPLSFNTTYEVRGAGTFDIDIRTGSVRGRVVDATTGRPIEGATVNIRQRDTSSGLRFPMSAFETDAAGNFTIPELAAGTYALSVEKQGYGTKVSDLNVSGGSSSEQEVKLSPHPGMTIRVVDARDNRTLGANIRVFDSQNRVVYETPMQFGFGGTPETVNVGADPGSYRAVISASGYATQNRQVTSPGNFTIGLTPGGSLVIRSRASEPRRARLMMGGQPYDRGSMNPFFTIDPSPGITELNNIAPGVYTLQIVGTRGEVIASEQVNVTEGGRAVVEF